MVTWEYLDVAISKSKNKWVVDGKEAAGDNVTRASILNRYGEEGWELVSVTAWQANSGAGHTYYFKRQAGEK